MVRSNWFELSLDLINYSSKNIDNSKAKMSVAFNCLRIILNHHVLQGDPAKLLLLDTIIDMKIMSNKIGKGLKNICDLQKLDFPKKLINKNWQFMKKKVVKILSIYGLEWTLGEEAAISDGLLTGVCC